MSAMQLVIYPPDHESRHSSYHGEDDIPNSSEETPLLPRFPRRDERINVITFVVAGLMLFLVFSGVAIAIYLIATESSSNLKPKVQLPPRFVPRSEWDAMSPHFAETIQVFKAKSIVLEETKTNSCLEENFCIKVMKELEENIDENKTLPYNFLISTDGFIYEYLGWETPSPLYPGRESLAIAFIGNFTDNRPSWKQIQSAGNLVTASVSNNYLDKNFTIVAKTETKLASEFIHKSIMEHYRSIVERRRQFFPKRYFFKSDDSDFSEE